MVAAKPVASIGDIVLFHHPEDKQDWPAMVLAVEALEPVEPDGKVEHQYLLQVFRARANHWGWYSPGVGFGGFSPLPQHDLHHHPDAKRFEPVQ